VTTTSDAGSAAVELAVLTPVLVLLLLFVVAVGRVVQAHQEVGAAAADAARAASIASSSPAAHQAAGAAAAEDLAGAGLTCATLQTVVDTRDFWPGGTVRVEVRCTASLQGLSLLRLPGAATIDASAVAPVDLYRSTTS
jgi:Flp pilus assembly protein TadG